VKTESLLVELGTEELPPRALSSLSDAFTAGITRGLAEHRLTHGDVRSFATPRRLAVLVEDLSLHAADEEVEVLGPPAANARDENDNWTAAAQGFARKQGVDPDELDIVETDKGHRLAFHTTTAGTRADSCIQEILERTIGDMPIPKQMRWGSSRREFVRPVHWLVVMLGKSVVDCELLELNAGNQTRGHRFHSGGDVKLKAAANYEASLESAHVIADFGRRREMIREQVITTAESVGAEAVIEDELLDEVTALVEWPVALAGSFEPRFLEIPPEALISSMKEHQKYFHLVDANGQLVPRFIFVANIESRDPAQVIDGNERVIRPRLSDADFFFNNDKQRSLASRVEALGNVVFQQKLGTVLDKAHRLQKLSAAIAPLLNADPAQAERAALLCKTDLTTLMVAEFPDMQGVAGRYYAIHDGEDDVVADALQQQYWPAFAGDRLPDNAVATTLALADRLDTMVGIFGVGQAPTGSKDPFALRRAALGVLRILVENSLSLDLEICLESAVAGYPAGVLAEGTSEQVRQYILERMRSWYEDTNVPVEVFKAVAAKNLAVPLDIDQRVRAVHAFTALPQAAALAAANKRVSNILSKQAAEFNAGEVSDHLLTEAAEKHLAEELERHRPALDRHLQAGAYTEALTSLADLQEPVDRFFDAVMVMDENMAVRNNRLNLLHALRQLFLQVADISLLAPAK
jgi:glycyl-tRNA synthetase beta chain